MVNVKRIAYEIFRFRKAMPMMVLDPTRQQSRIILKALRGYFGIDIVEDPVYRQYITMRTGEDHNKFHYFVVFETADGKFNAANAYGRIGYTPKVFDLGIYSQKSQALNVVKNKLQQKLKPRPDGQYVITPLD